MTLVALALGFCAFVALVVALSTGQEAWAVGTIVLALLGALAQVIEVIHLRRTRRAMPVTDGSAAELDAAALEVDGDDDTPESEGDDTPPGVDGTTTEMEDAAPDPGAGSSPRA